MSARAGIAPATPGTHPLTLALGGTMRQALVHVPPGLAGSGATAPVPLVCMLHGAGATAELALRNTGWAALADTERFIALFPEGTPRHADRPPTFRLNPQTWNDGSGRGHVARRGIDDVGFVAALLDAVGRTLPVDPARVYVTGFSNGAGLAYRVGAELAGRVAAVAAVAGHCWLESPRPARPVPLLAIYGAQDPLNPPAGGEIATPWGHAEYHPPVARSVERWAAGIGCVADPVVVQDAADVRLVAWPRCPGGAEVLLCMVGDMGHVWPGGQRLLPERLIGPASRRLDGTRFIWDFFRRHALPTGAPLDRPAVPLTR
ncbi:MAG TPA: PHB depolymerase family esterase [Gemmatimonadales bacterium]|nr:PHB depolymerase family esterase [Gemmatimonadales bacterium]